jgi:hypothetical protein
MKQKTIDALTTAFQAVILAVTEEHEQLTVAVQATGSEWVYPKQGDRLRVVRRVLPDMLAPQLDIGSIYPCLGSQIDGGQLSVTIQLASGGIGRYPAECFALCIALPSNPKMCHLTVGGDRCLRPAGHFGPCATTMPVDQSQRLTGMEIFAKTVIVE